MQFSPDVLTIKILEVLAQNMCVYFQILLTSPWRWRWYGAPNDGVTTHKTVTWIFITVKNRNFILTRHFNISFRPTSISSKWSLPVSYRKKSHVFLCFPCVLHGSSILSFLM